MDNINKEIREMIKMLRAIANAQGMMRQDIMRIEKKVDSGFEKVNERLDMQGEQLSELDDDAPTGEEFRKLDKRVKKVETKLASA